MSSLRVVLLAFACLIGLSSAVARPLPPPLLRMPGPTAPAPRALREGATSARPRNPLWSAIRPDDYPVAALRAGAEGQVGFELSVGTNARVTNCLITRSSGSADLDIATCRIMRSRAWFAPAHDGFGRPLPARVRSTVAWKLGDDPQEDGSIK